MQQALISGTITALITPFTGDRAEKIDYDSLEQLIEWQISQGIDGFVLCGTTAEVATLGDSERKELLRRSVEMISGRVPVIIGTGTNCTTESIRRTREAVELGVNQVLAICPYYNKPSQEGLKRHFLELAECSTAGVIVYNVPSRVVVDLSTDTIAELAKHEKIIGIKQAADKVSALVEISSLLDDGFALYAGDCPMTYHVLASGGLGVISASSNAIPELMCNIARNYFDGSAVDALDAQIKALPYIKALFSETNPVPAKEMLRQLGIIKSAAVRLPLVEVSGMLGQEIARLVGLLKEGV
ncbi:MAG: 4-hydroxy-tetrahydrodipicolinate synthase [bacterium]|nr:4-hydroxy-tetrahydrodipicolinate synthase [bacterium]